MSARAASRSRTVQGDTPKYCAVALRSSNRGKGGHNPGTDASGTRANSGAAGGALAWEACELLPHERHTVDASLLN